MIYKFAYAVEKLHPYVTEGPTEEHCFIALQQAIAIKPREIFNLKEEGIIFKCPKTHNTYQIKLQE